MVRASLLVIALGCGAGAEPASKAPRPEAGPRDDDLVDVAGVIGDAVIDIRYATADNFTGKELYPVGRKLRRAVTARLARAAEALRAQERRLVLWDCCCPEILGVGLSCAYVVASGVVKSVGAALLRAGISESWMPATAGLLFLPVFLAAVYGLSLIPAPSAADVAARTEREPMTGDERRAFVKRFLPGLLALVVAYLCMTAYRDFRDNYAAKIWTDLGLGQEATVSR